MRRTHIKKEVATQDASRLRIGIVVADYNSDITGKLLEGAIQTLHAWSVKENNIVVRHVPGAFEIPFACHQLLQRKKKLDAVIALGCILKGETKHDEYIASAAAQGIMHVMLKYHTPISFGILTPNTLAQARARSGDDSNKGKEAAVAALEMALL